MSQISEAALEQGRPTVAKLPLLLRDRFSGGLAGLIAGVLWLGLGSRVVMRVSALLNPDHRGEITDNGNVIGDITAGGSAGLIIFAGVFGGLAAGIVWVMVRDWLPTARGRRLAVAGLVAAATGSFIVITDANTDFHSLEPRALNVAMFVALVALTGTTTAWLDEVLQPRLPVGRRSAVLYALLALAGLGLAVPLLAFLFFIGDEEDAGPSMLAGICLIVSGVATVIERLRGPGRKAFGISLRQVGMAGVVSAVIFGTLDLAQEIKAIL